MSGSKREKQQQARRLRILSDAQVALGWFVILALAALVGTIYLSQASRIASVGRKVQILQNELDELKRENAALERSIARAQSLDRLQEEAARLGFTRAAPEDMEYLVISGYPTGSTATETTEEVPATAPVPPPTIGDALWQAAGASLEGLVTGDAGE